MSVLSMQKNIALLESLKKIPGKHTTGVVCKSECELFNEYCYRKSVRHPAMKCREHIGMSPLKKTKSFQNLLNKL